MHDQPLTFNPTKKAKYTTLDVTPSKEFPKFNFNNPGCLIADSLSSPTAFNSAVFHLSMNYPDDRSTFADFNKWVKLVNECDAGF